MYSNQIVHRFCQRRVDEPCWFWRPDVEGKRLNNLVDTVYIKPLSYNLILLGTNVVKEERMQPTDFWSQGSMSRYVTGYVTFWTQDSKISVFYQTWHMFAFDKCMTSIHFQAIGQRSR